MSDLQQCISLAPRPQQSALKEELQALQGAADRAAAQAQLNAAAAAAASYTDHGSVQIQEEVEDPADTAQVIH